jgi:hypothetical protein
MKLSGLTKILPRAGFFVERLRINPERVAVFYRYPFTLPIYKLVYVQDASFVYIKFLFRSGLLFLDKHEECFGDAWIKVYPRLLCDIQEGILG